MHAGTTVGTRAEVIKAQIALARHSHAQGQWLYQSERLTNQESGHKKNLKTKSKIKKMEEKNMAKKTIAELREMDVMKLAERSSNPEAVDNARKALQCLV